MTKLQLLKKIFVLLDLALFALVLLNQVLLSQVLLSQVLLNLVLLISPNPNTKRRPNRSVPTNPSSFFDAARIAEGRRNGKTTTRSRLTRNCLVTPPVRQPHHPAPPHHTRNRPQYSLPPSHIPLPRAPRDDQVVNYQEPGRASR